MAEDAFLTQAETTVAAAENRLKTFSDVQGLDRVEGLYDQLNFVVGTLSNKVVRVLKRQEDEFLKDYHQHMANVAKMVSKLKKQLKEAEERMKNDSRSKILQQERDWFKKEAIRLDEAAISTRSENGILQQENATLIEERNWLETQLKKARRKSNILQDELSLYVEKFGGAEGLITGRSKEMPKCASTRELNTAAKRDEELKQCIVESKRPQTSQSKILSRNRPNSCKNTSDETKCFNLECKQKIAECSRKLMNEKRRVTDLQAEIISRSKENNELMKLFQSCVEDAKRSVNRRRVMTKVNNHKAGLKSKGRSSGNQDYYTSFYKMKHMEERELTALDRKRILNKFFLTESVFSFIYNQLFENDNPNLAKTCSDSVSKSSLPTVKK